MLKFEKPTKSILKVSSEIGNSLGACGCRRGFLKSYLLLGFAFNVEIKWFWWEHDRLGNTQISRCHKFVRILRVSKCVFGLISDIAEQGQNVNTVSVVLW